MADLRAFDEATHAHGHQLDPIRRALAWLLANSGPRINKLWIEFSDTCKSIKFAKEAERQEGGGRRQ